LWYQNSNTIDPSPCAGLSRAVRSLRIKACYAGASDVGEGVRSKAGSSGVGYNRFLLGTQIMSSISLVQKFGLQAVAGEYAGAETVLNFGSAADELTALRDGCGVFDLGWRGKLVLSGEDRVRWLNGMVTNNTRDLV